MMDGERRHRGFTLFELAVATSLIGLLAALLLSRLAHYQEQAERVAVRQLVANMRTALAAHSAHVYAARGVEGLRELAGRNPIDLLASVPDNYAGEYSDPDVAKIPQGSWYFDRADNSLVFLPTKHQSFSKKTSLLLRFNVKLLSNSDPQHADGQSKDTPGLVLDQVSVPPAVNN